MENNEIMEIMSEDDQSASLNHALLNNLDTPNQHPITAIIGLETVLNNIEQLKTVYSDKKNIADFYLWEDWADSNTSPNRIGYFVSVCEDVNKIKLCTGDCPFGVVVDVAGFVGGQNDLDATIDHRYGLVANSGVVTVRCETDVNVGDFVVPNESGYAQKDEAGYGYQVIARKNIGDISYATIVFNGLTSYVNGLKRMIVENSRLITGLESRCDELNAAIEAKSEELSNTIKTLDGRIEELNNTIEELNTKITELESRIEDLENDDGDTTEYVVVKYVGTNGIEGTNGSVTVEKDTYFTVMTYTEAGVTTGNQNYWSGSDGNYYYAGQTYMVTSDLILTAIYVEPEHTHSYGTNYQSISNTQHAKVCSCGAQTDVSNHTFGDWTKVNDDQCSHTCGVCGATISEDHSVYYDSDAGDTTYCITKCRKCGSMWQMNGHVWGSWMVSGDKVKRTCSVCNRTETNENMVVVTYKIYTNKANTEYQTFTDVATIGQPYILLNASTLTSGAAASPGQWSSNDVTLNSAGSVEHVPSHNFTLEWKCSEPEVVSTVTVTYNIYTDKANETYSIATDTATIGGRYTLLNPSTLESNAVSPGEWIANNSNITIKHDSASPGGYIERVPSSDFTMTWKYNGE